MHDSSYWKARFELIEQRQNEQGQQCYTDIERQYRQAQKQIEAQLSAWYQRFASNNGMTMSEARKMLAGRDLEEFKWDVEQYIHYGEENAINGAWMKQLENASARYHVSRLEALKIQTQQSLEVMFGNQLDCIDSTMRGVYTNGYYRAAYEIQKGLGVGWDFATLDDSQISKVINRPWAADGKNFSERIWGNRQRLVNELNTELTRNIILGQDPQKAIDALAKKMNASKANAGRLVMTEEAFFSSAAQRDCFRELDIEEFEIVVTLDSHTSEICQEMDGKHFPMSQWEVGTTAPPFHVRCRTTTIPYFKDNFGVSGERAARGADGKTYYVPADMAYTDWQKSFVVGDKTGLQETGTDDTIKIRAERKMSSVIQNLPTIESIKSDDDRKAFAEQLIDGIGISRVNMPVSLEKMRNARGACSFYARNDKGVCNYIRYSLQKGDERDIKYQIKTAFHESYHLSLQGNKWDAVVNGKINPKWVMMEETFAETSAHYATQLYGIEGLSPAYADKLIQTLPRLKRLPKYSGCSNLADFGEIAWAERLSGQGGVWGKLYDDIFSASFDESKYFCQYFEYMRDHAELLLDIALENSPGYLQYREQMKGELESAMEKVKSGTPISRLNQNERFVFSEALINAMMKEGVK